jgi:hypothetical protein
MRELDQRKARSARAYLPLALVSIAFLSWGMGNRPPTQIKIWEPLSPPKPPDLAASQREPWAIQEQTVRFTPEAMALFRELSKPIPGPLQFDLPDMEHVTVEIISRKRENLASTIVEGHTIVPPGGSLVLAVREEAVAGILRLGQRLWRVEYRGNFTHRLVEIDQTRLPPD